MDANEFGSLLAANQKAAGLTTSPTITSTFATEEVVIVKQIMVQTQFAALHCWPTAPMQVSYLSFPHRHLFKVVLLANVTHGDRAVEFHMVLRDLNSVIKDAFFKACGTGVYSSPSPDMNGLPTLSMSCEDMAELIGQRMQQFCDVASVLVTEDGENGGYTTFYRRGVPTVPAGKL